MEFDASKHDTNCAFAADPANACDCGGPAVRKPPANENNGLAGLAGELACPPHDVAQPIMQSTIRTVSQQIAANKQAIMVMVADRLFGAGKWDIAKVRAKIDPMGETYSFAGKDFLRLSPVAFENEAGETAYKITVKQEWKVLGDE